MDATGSIVNCQREAGSVEKPHQRLPFGRILDPAHRHPQSRKHRGRIGEEGLQALARPSAGPRRAPCAAPANSRTPRSPPTARPITPERLGPGRPRSAGSRLWQARQGVNARAPSSSAVAEAGRSSGNSSRTANNLTQARPSGSRRGGRCRIRRPRSRRAGRGSAARWRALVARMLPAVELLGLRVRSAPPRWR